MKRKLFEDIKVADFTWAGVGPRTIKYLADYGAEIVKIESVDRPDPLRALPPFKDNIPGVNRSAVFARLNTNKYDITLNLSNSKALKVAKKIISWADVVVESYSPGTMAAWGLDYENVRKFKPDIIMVSTSMLGQTGPFAGSHGYGYILASFVGFNYITGWPDRDPSGVYGPFTDFIAPLFNGTALLAAIDYKRRTGKGQYLDLSQYESSIHFLSPLILDYTVNGREPQRRGNRSNRFAPHGTYKCKGDDRWCAIAVSSDEEWRNFCNVLGNPDWTNDLKFATHLLRINNSSELDKFVEEWTSERSVEEIVVLLQKAGIAAGVAANAEDMLNHAQLKHDKLFWHLNHPEMGECFSMRAAVNLSEASYEMTRPPILGEHTEHVCKKILGMADKDFQALKGEGVFD